MFHAPGFQEGPVDSDVLPGLPNSQDLFAMDVAPCEALRLLPPTPTLTGVAYDDVEVPVDGRTGLEKGQHLCIAAHLLAPAS